MSAATSAIRDLARRSIAREAARAPVGEAGLVCLKLRMPLARLAGLAGFRSLMARALALATVEVPWLAPVRLRDDGSLEGFDEAGDRRDAVARSEAGVEIVAQLLGLLVMFIGEPLMLRLVRDAWPDAPPDEAGGKVGGPS